MAEGPLRLTVGAPVLPPPSGRTTVFADADGQIKQLHDDATETPFLSGDTTGIVPVVDSYAVQDDGPAMQEVIDRLAAGSGGEMCIPPGEHRLRSGVVLDGVVGIDITGHRAASRIIIDDSDGNIGDGFLLKNTLSCSIRDLTITAQSPRTAGNAIHVRGGFSTETINGGQYGLRLSRTTIARVDMNDQFNGIVCDNDTVNNYNNWMTFIHGGHHRNFSNGGVGIWINCATEANKIGASHYITEYWFDKTPGMVPGGALAGIRLQSSGDTSITNTDILGADYALLIDPPANGFFTCLTVTGGFYDTSNVNCLRIAPSVATAALKFNNVWFGTAFTSHIAYLNGFGAKGISFNGCDFANAGEGWGALVTSGSNLAFDGCVFSSCASGGLIFNGSASDFLVNACRFVLKEHPDAINALPVGIQIDAGCDRYSVTNNIIREPATPITNTPGLSDDRRIISGNVLL